MSTKTTISAVSDHLGYWLRFVSNNVSQEFARKVEAHGVTVAEWVVLRELLDEDALAPNVLASRMGMTRGAISKLADRLLVKALITRKADPADGSAQTLALTAKGRTLVPKLAALADLNDSEFFSVVAPKDRATLLRILREVVDARGLKAIPID